MEGRPQGDGSPGGPVAPPEARALRAIFYAGGLIASLAGAHSALAGARALPGQSRADSGIESEIRYYSAFYSAYGVTMLAHAPRAEREPRATAALAATLFAGGIARAGGWLAAGPPHPVQRALLAVELVAPAAIVACRCRIAARSATAV